MILLDSADIDSSYQIKKYFCTEFTLDTLEISS